MSLNDEEKRAITLTAFSNDVEIVTGDIANERDIRKSLNILYAVGNIYNDEVQELIDDLSKRMKDSFGSIFPVKANRKDIVNELNHTVKQLQEKMYGMLDEDKKK